METKSQADSPAQAYQVREPPMEGFIGAIDCRVVISIALDMSSITSMGVSEVVDRTMHIPPLGLASHPGDTKYR